MQNSEFHKILNSYCQQPFSVLVSIFVQREQFKAEVSNKLEFSNKIHEKIEIKDDFQFFKVFKVQKKFCVYQKVDLLTRNIRKGKRWSLSAKFAGQTDLFYFCFDFSVDSSREDTRVTVEMEFQEPASCSYVERTINKFTSGKNFLKIRKETAVFQFFKQATTQFSELCSHFQHASGSFLHSKTAKSQMKFTRWAAEKSARIRSRFLWRRRFFRRLRFLERQLNFIDLGRCFSTFRLLI